MAPQLAHVFVLRSVSRDLDLAGGGRHLEMDVVDPKNDHNGQAQNQAQNKREGFFQLLPLVHGAFMVCNRRGGEGGRDLILQKMTSQMEQGF